jgi:hypothetical protein
MSEYRHTHASNEDFSPAMQVGSDPFTLENEDGYRWEADPEEWHRVCEHANPIDDDGTVNCDLCDWCDTCKMVTPWNGEFCTGCGREWGAP